MGRETPVALKRENGQKTIKGVGAVSETVGG